MYQGERTLPTLVRELVALVAPTTTADGSIFRIDEILLVHDNGPDRSAAVIREMAREHAVVRPVWLSRNFGQHPATLAGIASSGGDWIVTMDEDCQHDPADIGPMLDTALREQADVVYAKPTNAPPHGALRNFASAFAKRMLRSASDRGAMTDFHSYRLMLGDVGRSLAAYAGVGVYIDVALQWVAGKVTTHPARMREEIGRPSGYRWRSLLSHFWRMVLTSGTRGLRAVSLMGAFLASCGILLAVTVVIVKLGWGISAPGWSSLMTAQLVIGGAVLFSLGVIAEYVGIVVNMAMGKPPYLVVSDRADGPLGRRPERPQEPRIDGSPTQGQ